MSSTLLQPAAFLTLVYGGAVAGLAYDVFRLLRRALPWRAAQVICDALFLLCASAAAIIALLYATGGDIRPYLCAAYIVGFVVQQWSLSNLFFKLLYTLLPR
jgi:hypothetical protein